MSDYHSEIRDAIVGYLKKEFPDHTISEEMAADSYCFRLLKKNASPHYLRVMFSAIHSHNAGDIEAMLKQYAPAGTMRDLGDFPVVVTEQGCMFGCP